MPSQQGSGSGRVRGRPVRRLGRPLLLVIAVVEAAAVGLTSWSVCADPVTRYDVGVAVLLVGLELASTDVVLRFGRGALRAAGSSHIGLLSVWVFAGALALPAGLGALVAVVVQTHVWLRAQRTTVPLHRNLYTTAVIVLSCLAARATGTTLGSGAPLPDIRVVLLAAAVFAVVNSLLIALAIAVSEMSRGVRPSPVVLFGRPGDSALELAFIALGALTAVAIAINPWFALFVLPAMVVMERAVQLPQLEQDARVDGKTGLLNVATWHRRADGELRRGGRSTARHGLLVIDLDHFKDVNDTHGHLVGDIVLATVADTITTSVRGRDLVGRFGGEEFVVLLTPSGADGETEIVTVAERIRERVARLRVEVETPAGPRVVSGLRVSIGGALQRSAGDPEGRGELGDLLRLADAALYTAKRGGRNQVRVGEWSPPPA